MVEFLAWRDSNPSSWTPSARPSHAYNGIPIVEVDRDTHRSVIIVGGGKVLRID